LKTENREGARLKVAAVSGYSSDENKTWRARPDDRSAISFPLA
jgi:hypothetical protein